jgi:hypothetical protein
MDDGKVAEIGHPFELLSNPETRELLEISSDSIFA